MKTTPPMNTFKSLTLWELHQFWQAVILKPFKLDKCTLHFWKPPIFINLVVAAQRYSFILNTLKSFPKMDRFIIVSVVAGYISIWPSVHWQEYRLGQIPSACTIPWPTWGINTIDESFQMKYCMKLFINWHLKFQRSNFYTFELTW